MNKLKIFALKLDTGYSNFIGQLEAPLAASGWVKREKFL
jgi:hypothetical protein